jgi:hypothetical protein
MEKNCTNCKFNIPVEGISYSGFCTDDFQCGNITSEDTVCSRYKAKELTEKGLKNTIDNMQETIEGLKCCTSGADGCKTCPFARYECTCQQDLKFSALQLLSKQKSYIEALERMVGGYAADQEIWLARNDALEKENKSLWDSYHQGYKVGYEYGKQDALSADRAEPSKERPEVEG